VKLPEHLFFSNSFSLYLAQMVKFFYKTGRECVVILWAFDAFREAQNLFAIDFSMIIWQYFVFTVNRSVLRH